MVAAGTVHHKTKDIAARLAWTFLQTFHVCTISDGVDWKKKGVWMAQPSLIPARTWRMGKTGPTNSRVRRGARAGRGGGGAGAPRARGGRAGAEAARPRAG